MKYLYGFRLKHACNYLGVTLAVAFLLSCDLGSDAAMTAAKHGAPNVINGIAVPPDPGAAKDATIAGVDSDNNGIRDEIDRWIATKYGDKPGALEAIQMVARSDQLLLNSTPATQADAIYTVYQSFDVGACTYEKLDNEGVRSTALFNESMIRTYNTRARIDARKKIFASVGMILRSVTDSVIDCPYR